MHVTLWHSTNACHTMDACHTVAWYQCISHYGIIPMHVTLWHDTNACHTMAWYISIDVTLYGIVPMVTLWHGSYHCYSTNVRHTVA